MTPTQKRLAEIINSACKDSSCGECTKAVWLASALIDALAALDDAAEKFDAILDWEARGEERKNTTAYMAEYAAKEARNTLASINARAAGGET